MKSCPDCKALVEPFELACHGCGKSLSDDIAPVIASVAPSAAEMTESYLSWLGRGMAAIDNGDLEDASNCLREAIKRSRALDEAETREREARKMLAEVLEKLGKLLEAADQYRIIAQDIDDSTLREGWLKKSQDLVAASSSFPYELLFRKEEFLPVNEEDAFCVPLYCSGCKRPLAEAEVYGFRKGLSDSVRCWCGVEEIPLAKQDAKHMRALEDSRSLTGQRAQAIRVASQSLAGAKEKSKAVFFAFCTGWFGGHKFYLGDKVTGFIYLMWCWTLVPFLLSIYEGLMLIEMSVVTFNMTYNMDLVLAQISPEEVKGAANMEVFSLELGENEDEEEQKEQGLKKFT